MVVKRGYGDVSATAKDKRTTEQILVKRIKK